MICSKCGAENADPASHCSCCGEALKPSTPKPKRVTPLFYVFVGATLALVTVLLIVLLTGGKEEGRTPEEAVRDYLQGEIEGDVQLAAECLGHDYIKTKVDTLNNPEAAIEQLWEVLENDLYWEEYGLVGMDRQAWAARLEGVEGKDAYVKYYVDFYNAYQKCRVETFGISYEILRLEITAVEGEELEAVREYCQSRYDWKTDRNYTVFYEPEEVESFCTAELELSLEMEGTPTVYTSTFLIAQTEHGCYILIDDWRYEAYVQSQEN